MEVARADADYAFGSAFAVDSFGGAAQLFSLGCETFMKMMPMILLCSVAMALSGCGTPDLFQPAAPSAPLVFPIPGSSQRAPSAGAQILSSFISQRGEVTSLLQKQHNPGLYAFDDAQLVLRP
jgi:hypothetical protein